MQKFLSNDLENVLREAVDILKGKQGVIVSQGDLDRGYRMLIDEGLIEYVSGGAYKSGGALVRLTALGASYFDEKERRDKERKQDAKNAHIDSAIGAIPGAIADIGKKILGM